MTNQTDEIRWTMRPEDQGQAIRVEYALTDDGEYALRRTTDAKGRVTIERSHEALEGDWTPYARSSYDEPTLNEWEWEVIEAPCTCTCECPGRYRETPDGSEGRIDDPGGGEPLCDECSDYYVTDDGEVVCSRTQDEETCRHCERPIHWGSIQTGAAGVANWIEGVCSCRAWRQTERGGTWVTSEGQAWPRDGRYAVVVGGEHAEVYAESCGEVGSALRRCASLSEAQEYAERVAMDYHYGVEVIDHATWEAC